MKKIFTFLLLSFFSLQSVSASFTDTDFSWYKESIYDLQERGVIDGFDDGSFHPEDLITRAEIFKIILNSSGTVPIDDLETDCFIDVPSNLWFAKYICTGVELKIANGFEDGTFRPNNNVTVLEALAFAVRAYDVDIGETKQGDQWYEKYRSLSQENKIFPEHNYTINTLISRGQAAELISRLHRFSEEKELDFASTGCGIEPGLQSGEYSIDVNGTNRQYLLYVPQNTTANIQKALIVAFHGRTNSNDMVRDYMKLGGGSYRGSQQSNFIVAYPAGMGSGPYSWSQYENIEFFDALITEVSEKLCVNRDQVFSVGHSLGSYMSNKVSCLRGDVIRAMVGVASDGYNGNCTGPVSSLITHLDGDPLASYQGGLNAYRYKSEQNLCGTEEKTITLGDIKNCTQKVSCSTGNTVVFCNSYTTYGNDLHSWPKDGSDDILDFLRDIEEIVQ